MNFRNMDLACLINTVQWLKWNVMDNTIDGKICIRFIHDDDHFNVSADTWASALAQAEKIVMDRDAEIRNHFAIVEKLKRIAPLFLDFIDDRCGNAGTSIKTSAVVKWNGNTVSVDESDLNRGSMERTLIARLIAIPSVQSLLKRI
jgi:hypothetical protein